LGITAKQGSSDTQITLTMDTIGNAGNIINALASASGVNIIDVTGFTGGAGADIKVYPPDSNLLGVREPSLPKSYISKGMKRTVNIENIQSKTGSIGQGETTTAVLGNYWEPREIVKIEGPNNQKKWLVNNYLTAQTSSENPSFRRTNTQTDGINIDFALPSRPKERAIFVDRFSSPGDFTTMTRGYLDPIAEEYSAYNALPWRYHFQLNSSGSVLDSPRTWRGATTPYGNTPVTSQLFAGSPLAATAVDAIDTTGYIASDADASFTIAIPTSAGGLGGTAVTFLLDKDKDDVSQATAAANTITIGTKDGTDALVASFLINAINGVTAGRFIYASSGNGQAGHDLGITAAEGSSDTQITLTMDTVGSAGKITSAIASTAGVNIVDVTDFTSGFDGKINDYRMNIPVHVAQHVTSSQHVLEDFAGLNVLLSRHTGKFGIDSFHRGAISTIREQDYKTKASYHKVHRNTLKRLELTSTDGGKQYTVITASTHDNAYVRHSIPRSDMQYSWITASAYLRRDPLGVVPTGRSYDGKVTASLNLGDGMPGWHQLINNRASPHPDFPSFTRTKTSSPYVEPITFIDRSEVASFAINGKRYWSLPIYQNGQGLGSIDGAHNGPGPAWGHRVPVDFVGINFNIYEPITSSLGADGRNYDTASINTLGYPSAVIGNPNNSDTQKTLNYLNSSRQTGDERWDDDPLWNSPTGDSDGRANWLNAIILHRQGPYGWPSWKQIRGAQHPIARLNRKNNIVQYVKRTTNAILEINTQNNTTYYQSPHLDEVIVESKPVYTDTIKSFIVPPVTSRYQPLVHSLQDAEGFKVNIKHSYGINKNYTPYAELNENLSSILCTDKGAGSYPLFRKITCPPEPQTYDALTEQVIDKSQFGLYYMSYTENIYPKEKFTYLAKTRGRTDYTEVSSSQREKGIWTNKKIGFQRTFWKDNWLERRGGSQQSVTNSLGFIEDLKSATKSTYAGAGINQDHSCPALSIWPLDGEAQVGMGSGTRYARNDTSTWLAGELLAPNNSIYASIDGWRIQPSSVHYMAMAATASQQFLFQAGVPVSYDSSLGIDATTVINNSWTFTHHHFYRADEFSGNAPWYNSYEDYAQDIRVMAKDHTIIPEFRISEHMDHYVDNGFIFNNEFLTLEGSYPELSSSAAHPSASYNKDFFKTYSHSDFMKYFGKISSDYKDLSLPTKMTLKCSGIKKLLPYQGFYPVLRCVQLGSMFSSSFAPYISGSDLSSIKKGPDGGTVNDLSLGTPRGVQIQSLIQPFFAPGIMYNTIKSGIAVDWPMITGSAQGSVQGITSWNSVYFSGSSENGELFTFRMPFEALVEPQSYMPLSQSNGSGRMLYTWHKTGSMPDGPWFDYRGQHDNKYGLAMHNFLGEVPRFFLEDESFTTFVSAPESKFQTMKSGSTYFMDVELAQTHNFIMAEGPRRFEFLAANARPILWDARGSIYGPPCQVVPDSTSNTRARIFPDGNTDGGSKKYYNYVNHLDPAFAPFTPPHFYQKAIARLQFSPHQAIDMLEGESRVFSLDEILSRAKTETRYSGSGDSTNDIPKLPGDTAGFGPGHATRTCGSGKYISQLLDSAKRDLYPAGRYRMRLSSSMNLFGKSRLKVVEYETMAGQALSDEFKAVKATDSGDSSFDVWTISSKFETPTLNFSGSNVKSMLDIKYDNGYSIGDYPDFSSSIGTRCMWGAYGVIPSGSEGLFLQVKESFPDKLDIPDTTTGSLMKVCGFREEKRRVGSLAQSKTISEAVLAIPFVIRYSSRKFFKISKKYIKYLKNTLTDYHRQNMESEGNLPGTSITNMYETLGKYYLPPQLDFINNDEIDPFVIYAFEFTHKLDKQDLSDIWQNLMPKIAKNPEAEEITICHDFGPREFFHGEELPEDTQWMVFKVKRRAEQSYYNVTADTEDDSRFKFAFHRGGEKKVPTYSYNWPYDFFSLVELAKIGAEVRFEPHKSEAARAMDSAMAYTMNQLTAEAQIHETLTKQEKHQSTMALVNRKKEEEVIKAEYARLAYTGDPAAAAAYANLNNLDAWDRRNARRVYLTSQLSGYRAMITSEQSKELGDAVAAEIETYGTGS
jgi:hypothetical protein